MAISKDKKNTLVADLTELLTGAKTTVYAKYQGFGTDGKEHVECLL